MSSEIEKARNALLGEPIVTDHGETTCDLCFRQSLLDQYTTDQESAQFQNTSEWGLQLEQGDSFVASLWRRDQGPTDDGESVGMDEYAVMSLYHADHLDEAAVGLHPDEAYHQLLVKGTATAVPLDESEYATDLLIEVSEDDSTYAVFDALTELEYCSPDQGTLASGLAE